MGSPPDPDYDPTAETEYECLGCGHTETATTHPGACPECGGALRNTGLPME